LNQLATGRKRGFSGIYDVILFSFHRDNHNGKYTMGQRWSGVDLFAEMRSRLKRLTPGWTEGALITAEREVAAVEKKKLERKKEIGVLKEHRGDIVDC